MPRFRTVFILAVLSTLTACTAGVRSAETASASAAVRNSAGADLGTLRLESGPAGVRITGQLTGLPAGAHGVHLHQVGRCDAPEFTTAGAHLNPAMMKHGLLNPEGPHAGDLPAIGADAGGRAAVDVTTARVTLTGDVPGLFDADGTSIVVHSGNDDQKTDPSGNSGGRIACGVIVRN
jgi:Cu-Zn family superoxide dismutase